MTTPEQRQQMKDWRQDNKTHRQEYTKQYNHIHREKRNKWKRDHLPHTPITSKTCINCDKLFTTNRPRQVFCSPECRKSYHSHKSREKHLDKRKAYGKKYNKQNASIIATKTATYRATHKKEIQTWHNLHIVDIREHKKKRLKEDPNYKLRRSLANKVRQALRGTRKSQHTLELLGCSVEYLKMHLEALFQPGMTWDNWEQYGWHIDHKLPISSFNLVDPEQQKLCFHYTNLQPLWWLDNIRKSNKINSILQNSI